MCYQCSSGAGLIDAAIEEGRIDSASRDTFLRAFESTPDLVVGTLAAAKPNEVLATQNYLATLSDAEDVAYRADFERRYFVPAAEVL